jgi:hypothetical protein
MNVTFCLWPIPGDVFSPPTNSEALPPPRHPCVVLDLATDGSGEAQLVSGLKVAPRDGEQNTAEQTTHGWRSLERIAMVDFILDGHSQVIF